MNGPPPQSAFRRLFPPSQWRSRQGVSLVGWSLGAVAALLAVLLLSTILVDLLVHRGQLAVRANSSSELETLLAGTRFASTGAAMPGDVELHDSGLLPTVWYGRSRWWSGPLRTAWRRMPALQTNFGALSALLGSILLVGVFRAFAVSHVRMLAARLAMQAATSLRRAVHRQAMRLGPSDLDGGEQRTALDLFVETSTAARRALAGWLRDVVQLPAMFAVLLLVLLITDWRLALQCLIPLAGVGWVTRDERRRGADLRMRADAEADAELRPLADGLRKTRLVRAYGMEEFEHAHFQVHLERYAQKMLGGREGETWALRTARWITVLLIVVIAFLLSWRVLWEHSRFPLGATWLMAACLIGLVLVFDGLKQLREFRQQALLSAERVYRYLSAVPEVSQAVGAKFLNPVSQSVILEAVTYRRDGQSLLERVDLRIPARTSTAIVSMEPLSSRAIAYLLPRFIEPHSGRILFDSEDIAWATLESLRAETIYVSAEDPFFTGTVLENLVCGESRFTTQEAMDASKLTHAHKFITALPNGYETQLGEHGEQLTSGQAFRLGLARAMLRNPAVLIIEEPQSRLDDDSKALVDDAYSRILKDRTVIFLPTRLSTVKISDRTVFLSRGRVEAVGPHSELVRKCEAYRHWEYVNFSDLSRALS